MDDPFAVDVQHGSPTAAETARSSSSSSSMSEGLKAGQQIAKISVITLVAIGIVELVVGQISGSIVATADGIDSLSDAMISLIVFVGLYLATRPANKRFPFGYYKVESFAALLAAIGMVAIGAFILYHSYESFVNPHRIEQPVLTMVVLASAGGVSLHRALQMRKIARKYDLLSLKTDAKNSIKDGSASIIGFVSVLVASQFGFLQMDAIGGMIIAGYIFSVAYFSLRQSSLTLVDAWQNPGTSDKVKQLIESKFQAEPVKVRSVFLRPTGMMAHAEVHLEVDGDKKLQDFESLSFQVQSLIRSKFRLIDRISVIPHPLTFDGGGKKKGTTTA
ncbi:cation diffusion facilitator family transporter [Candidatus Nitrososphaera evergladensis]|uniref:cation diffusion facilitator family transporter n=1 Tax=Candidatus Nitrososphaera evergladensis TaxID=1459637 RepID=UPI00130E5604|nr:cation diffusion facilitator family transporter [Candidatus Nitrososphaera evergladensis]